MKLSAQQRDDLEEAALLAFTGSLSKLAHGFRIQTSAGQVAAIYWSELNPGNELEIALAPVRLTEHYDLSTTLTWISATKAKYPGPCNVHKHGSEWPIFGVSYAEAMAVLADCRRLRRGGMSQGQLADLKQLRAAQSSQEATASLLAAELEGLRPRARHAVIDLVRKARISVEHWYKKADGTPAVNPRSNPAYCYDWSFGGGQEPAVACLWHNSMRVEDGKILFAGNLLLLATRLEQIAADPARPAEHRDRARPQAARARRLDELLRNCHDVGSDVRVIVNEGNARDESSLGEKSSWVKVRLLDPVAWKVVAYDTIKGDCVLHRKSSAVVLDADGPAGVGQPDAPGFADQHELLGTDMPARVLTVAQASLRDRAVRLAVLKRADGHCELCDAPGFALIDGRFYLETHHVQPLAEGGTDRAWNVVGLCPTHHREAHYGQRRCQIKGDLLALLESMYPDKTDNASDTLENC